jgi:hypothetical protein
VRRGAARRGAAAALARRSGARESDLSLRARMEGVPFAVGR